ncbi:hypothetical protein [Amycolatopsis sp.]|uniref:hypothetical protein n=1 Tax=Amycolatopsis sp. TaxID=37632 RepID=UPI0039C871F2
MAAMRLASTESKAPAESKASIGAPRPVAAWWLPAGVAVASAVVFALVRSYLIDDAYITLSYAENLAFHGHWGLIEEGTANTATSPLNVLALAALTFVVRDAVLAAGVLFVLCQVSVAFALRRLGARAGLPSWFAPLAAGLLLVNPLLVSSIGLELALGSAVLLWLFVFSVERRPVEFGLALGLLALVRLDLLVVAAVIFFARRDFWLGIWRTTFAALAVTVPWFLFSWTVLGSAVPDTLIIKTLQQSWGPWDFTNGPLVYWRHFPIATMLSFLPLVAGALIGLLWTVRYRQGSERAKRLQPFAVLAIAGAVHYVTYVWLTVPPYHWYYGPSIIAATVFVAASASVVERVRVGVFAVAAAVIAWSATVSVVLDRQHDYSAITTNHASSERYQQIGRELGALANGRVVRSAGEIGALAYSCQCAIVDIFSDRGSLTPAIIESKNRSGPLGRALIEANFRFLDQTVPPTLPDLVLEETWNKVPPGVLASWDISSPWTGSQHLYLRPLDG